MVNLSLIAIVTDAGLLIGSTFVEQIERLIRRLPGYLEILRSLFENLAIRLGMTEPEAVNEISHLIAQGALCQ